MLKYNQIARTATTAAENGGGAASAGPLQHGPSSRSAIRDDVKLVAESDDGPRSVQRTTAFV